MEKEARDVIRRSGADAEEHFNQVEAVNLGVTFHQQAEWWLDYVQTRKRNPVKPKTAASWKDCLKKWLNPNLGDMPLSSVNNLTVRELVSKMAGAGLAPKSIHNYVQVVKMVVALAVNEQGDEIYPRKWNHDFIDLPEVANQRTPSFTGEEVSTIVASASRQYQMLYALLGGAGLRIGEALGLEIKHVATTAPLSRFARAFGMVGFSSQKPSMRFGTLTCTPTLPRPSGNSLETARLGSCSRP